MEKQSYTYILPIGMAPSAIEKVSEEIQTALNARCIEIESAGRRVTITAYKGAMPSKVRYEYPETTDNDLLIPVGLSITGERLTIDMASDSHCYMLVGGNPGTGKSVFLNGAIASLVQYPSSHVRLVLIDMKMGAELAHWGKYPHKWLEAYDPFMPELKHVVTMVKAEIKDRMKEFKSAGVRKLSEWNELFPEQKKNYIFMVIDEYAELKNSKDGDEIEEVMRSVLMTGRAAGVRATVATQRPTVDSISGSLKALMTDRLAFLCADKLNSRVILDREGAEKLPRIAGRSIFLSGSTYQEVQVAYYDASPKRHIESMVESI